MEIRVEQSALWAALDMTSSILSTRATMPILAYYELVTDGGCLRVTAFSYDMSVRMWIAADVQVDGAIALPGRILREYIASQPPEKLTININARKVEAAIISSHSTATIKGFTVEEFPQFLDPKGKSFSMLVSDLFPMVAQVDFCASTDQSKPTLCCVQFILKDGSLQLAATDGYRLAVRKSQVSSLDESTVLIMAEQLDKLGKLASKASGEVTLYQGEDRVWFDLKGKGDVQRILACVSLTDARFPDYWAIVPKTHYTKATIETAALLKALKVARLFARDNANIVRLRCAADTIDVWAANTEMGDTNSSVSAEVNGDSVEIAFNVAFVIASLEAITQPKVVLEFTQSTRPGVLYPQGMDKLDFMYVMMPMHPPIERS